MNMIYNYNEPMRKSQTRNKERVTNINFKSNLLIEVSGVLSQNFYCETGG